MSKWLARCGAVAALLALCQFPALAMPLNPEEVGLVVENYIVDTDATMIGLLHYASGSNHPETTFTYRSSWIGPPDSALPSVPLASRTEWQVWRGKAFASLGGDDYSINYAGYMKDTRAAALDDPTYDIRWKSTWFKNDPAELTPYAEGSGGFKFSDPEFSFIFELDPAHPNDVTIGGSAGVTLWGFVNVSISGKKSTDSRILTASAGVSADIPIVSDIFGSVASAEFEFTYNQRTGAYASKIKTEALFGILSDETAVNKGSIVTPAKKVDVQEDPPPAPPRPRSRPVETGRRNPVATSGGLGTTTPPVPTFTPPPWEGPPVETYDPYNPYGQLATMLMTWDPSLYNFGTVPVSITGLPEYIYPHPGFFDPTTFPEDDPPLIPGEGLGFSYMDPLFGGGLTIGPVTQVPEPATLALVAAGLAALLRSRRRRRAA